MNTYACVSRHAEDLTGGRTLLPGERAEVDADDPHNKRLIDEGKLVPVGEAEGPSLKELQSRAKELEVEGRSNMNKEQLAEAVAEAELNGKEGDPE